MSLDPGGHALSSLLSILKDNNLKLGSSITSVANATTIDLLRRLLSRDDYVGIAEKIRQDSDVMNLLEFILHVLRHRYLSNQDATMDVGRRARRLMFKIISKTPVVPRSLIVTEVSMPDKRDYIGCGGYGNVFKGEFRGTVVALKELYKNGANNLAFCREALMWGSLEHILVLPFIGIYEEEGGTAFLVSPYMKNGTLAQWRKNTNPSIAQITERMLEVAQGMEYIHSEGVVHGDIRGENVLLDADFRVQIADLGLTRLLDATNTQSGAKHINFSAPELFGCLEDVDDSDPSAEDPLRTQMSDVYAFGCIYYEIHYDRIPFAGRQEIQIVTLVSRGKRPPRQNEPPLSDEAWKLIKQCWATEPLKRPTMKDVTEQMMAISQSVSPPTSARNGGMFQDASLSPSTSGTTVRRTKVVPSTILY
ncbi:kinase-like domain-containing protein [Amanita rubescens]|nr:kinase-like domain-containing protein [Amanita rubescens]